LTTDLAGVAEGRVAGEPDRRRWLRLASSAALAALLALLAGVIARTAWVGDDAYITFRTIDNLLNGYGLRWNIAERVQTYTHPLWFLLLTPAVAAIGNPFVAALVVSGIVSAVAIGLIVAPVRARPAQAAFLIAAMVCSRAFVDYSTSGLENALSHALLAGLMWWARTPAGVPRRAFAGGLLVGLAALTRLDLILLAGPVGLFGLRHLRRTLPAFVLGLAPLAGWELFSVIYYGVPFPNTAYAKLATGIPPDELLRQGVTYFLDALQRDPLTLFVIASGASAALSRSGSRIAGLAVLAYLAYVARIGGDFMTGRFFSAPFVVSLCLLGRVPWPVTPVGWMAPLAAVMVLGLTVPKPTVLSGPAYTTPWDEIFTPSGIVDERGMYFQVQGWLSTGGPRVESGHTERLLEKIRAVKAENPRAFPHNTVGLAGYLTGPDRQILDVFGLGDPLLARLPAKRPWRIGHYTRELPEGYYETVITGRNQIADPRIASLYEVLREVTQGPLWSVRRWRAIVALNTGRTDGWPVN
jgi:arabinofuranosyltransferase